MLAKGDTAGGRRLLEIAANGGYRAARIDLADLMLRDPAKTLDIAKAASLYEKAWQDGVSIAAFRLGSLHESSAESAEVAEAWHWYQNGADVGEPNALVRFAERDERSALTEADSSRRNALLLHAFTRYAASLQGADLDKLDIELKLLKSSLDDDLGPAARSDAPLDQAKGRPS